MKLSSSLLLATAGALIAFHQEVQADILSQVEYDTCENPAVQPCDPINVNNVCSGLSNDNDESFSYGFKMDSCVAGTFLLGNSAIFAQEALTDLTTCSTLTLAEAQALEVTVACFNGGTRAQVEFSNLEIDIDVGAKASTTGVLYDVSPQGSGDGFLSPILNCDPAATGSAPDKCKGISHLNFCIPCPPTTTTTTLEPGPSTFDDPHFVTWNNTYFDFMGKVFCCSVLSGRWTSTPTLTPHSILSSI